MLKLIDILLRKHKESCKTKTKSCHCRAGFQGLILIFKTGPKKILRQHPENEAAVIDSSLELVSRASRRVSVRVNTLEREAMMETLRATVNVDQEMSRTQSAISELREKLDAIQNGQLEMERNSHIRYERQESLAHTFFNRINEGVQYSLDSCKSQFCTSFSGMQESLHGLIGYAQLANPRILPSAFGSSSVHTPCQLDSIRLLSIWGVH